MMAASDVLHLCRSPPSTSPATPVRPRPRDSRGWASTARRCARMPRPALLAAARHRPRPDDDAERRPAPLGAVRGLGGRGRARRLPGRLRVPRRWAGAARESYTVQLAPVRAHGAWGGTDPLAGAAAPAGGAPTAARSRSSPARHPPAQLRAFYRADPPAGGRPRRAAPGCSPRSAIGRVAARAPGDVLALALARPTRQRVRLRPPRPPRRRPPHARRALVLRGALRALPPLWRRRAPGTARIRWREPRAVRRRPPSRPARPRARGRLRRRRARARDGAARPRRARDRPRRAGRRAVPTRLARGPRRPRPASARSSRAARCTTSTTSPPRSRRSRACSLPAGGCCFTSTPGIASTSPPCAGITSMAGAARSQTGGRATRGCTPPRGCGRSSSVASANC